MTNSLRMPNRSASPRRDSFRQQLFGKPPGSPHDSSYAASMRSMANESSPGDSNFASHSRINRVSFGSITAPPDPSRRSDIQPGSTTTTANLLPSVKAWHTEVWLSAPAAEDRRVSELLVSASPAAKTYAAHSWAHAWQGLFDDGLLRLAYADLLLRWGLATARAELLLPMRGASSILISGRDIAPDSLSE